MAWEIWLVIGILLIIAEMSSLTFYLLWIALGALSAGITSLFISNSLLLQVLIGGVVAVLLTVYTKPLTRRMRTSRGYKDVIYDLVGREGVVMQSIPEEGLGIVKVGNETWSAAANEPLEVGTRVVIIHSSSTILQVRKGEVLPND